MCTFSCRLSPVVSKASSGAMELITVHLVPCMPTMLKVHFIRTVLVSDYSLLGCSKEGMECIGCMYK